MEDKTRQILRAAYEFHKLRAALGRPMSIDKSVEIICKEFGVDLIAVNVSQEAQ